jgi:hypothetical protein
LPAHAHEKEERLFVKADPDVPFETVARIIEIGSKQVSLLAILTEAVAKESTCGFTVSRSAVKRLRNASELKHGEKLSSFVPAHSCSSLYVAPAAADPQPTTHCTIGISVVSSGRKGLVRNLFDAPENGDAAAMEDYDLDDPKRDADLFWPTRFRGAVFGYSTRSRTHLPTLGSELRCEERQEVHSGAEVRLTGLCVDREE